MRVNAVERLGPAQAAQRDHVAGEGSEPVGLAKADVGKNRDARGCGALGQRGAGRAGDHDPMAAPGELPREQKDPGHLSVPVKVQIGLEDIQRAPRK
jgi:hypothetical protein